MRNKEAAAEKEPRKTGIEWFDKLPGAVQMLVLIGGIGVSLSLLVFIGSLFNSSTRTTTKPIALPTPAEVQAEKPTPQESDPEILWKNVGVNYANLQRRLSDMDDQVQKARAQAWIVQAQAKCSETPGCRNYYQWLLSSYQYYSQEVGKDLTYREKVLAQPGEKNPGTVLTRKMALDTKTIDQYRQDEAILRDIAAALAMQPGSVMNSPGLVLSNDLIESIKSFGDSAVNWEANKAAAGENNVAPLNGSAKTGGDEP